MIQLKPDDTLRHLTHSNRLLLARLAAAVLALTLAACDEGRRATRQPIYDQTSAAPYQAEVDEGLGAAIAILIDTSGSMKEKAVGDSRPKSVVARESLDAMFGATESLVAKRPDFAVKVGIYSFSSHASTVLPMQPFDRARLSAEGYGESHPIADNSTEQGRQRNRRVDIRVTDK